MKIYTFDPRKQKRVMAGVYRDNIFYKHVKKNHFMNKEKGYGIQEDVIQKLMGLGCKTVSISSSTNGHFFSMNYVSRQEIKDYGNGPQRFLGIEVPEKTNKNQIGLEI